MTASSHKLSGGALTDLCRQSRTSVGASRSLFVAREVLDSIRLEAVRPELHVTWIGEARGEAVVGQRDHFINIEGQRLGGGEIIGVDVAAEDSGLHQRVSDESRLLAEHRHREERDGRRGCVGVRR